MEYFSYKNLRIWQQSMSLVEGIYLMCERMPKSEIYGLTQQIKRSSFSIPSNIAEGYTRGRAKEIVHFLRISNGSASELETQLLIASRLRFLRTEDISGLLNEILSIQRQIQALIKKIEQDDK
jgi:four helix bundle protein